MKSTEDNKKFLSMSEQELYKELIDLTKKLTMESLKVKAGKQPNHSSVNKLRKSVARINTIISERGKQNE